MGEKLGLTPRAKIKKGSIIGSEPLIMLESPTPLLKSITKIRNIASDIDFWEVKEAFAVVPLRLMGNMKINHSMSTEAP